MTEPEQVPGTGEPESLDELVEDLSPFDEVQDGIAGGALQAYLKTTGQKSGNIPPPTQPGSGN
jgi:hypothetical protein